MERSFWNAYLIGDSTAKTLILQGRIALWFDAVGFAVQSLKIRRNESLELTTDVDPSIMMFLPLPSRSLCRPRHTDEPAGASDTTAKTIAGSQGLCSASSNYRALSKDTDADR
jgi:hypothetical protein